MGFRLRRSFGPRGFKVNVTKNGISSVSIGGKGGTANVPIGRKGGTRTTVGIPGTGLSWTEQISENKINDKPAQSSKSQSQAPSLWTWREWVTLLLLYCAIAEPFMWLVFIPYFIFTLYLMGMRQEQTKIARLRSNRGKIKYGD